MVKPYSQDLRERVMSAVDDGTSVRAAAPLFRVSVSGESLSIASDEDSEQGVLTRYTPPEPLLIAGMDAGDTREISG